MNLKQLFVHKSDHSGVHLLRSSAASLISFSLDYGIMVFLKEVIGLHYLLAGTCGFIVGVFLLHSLSVRWVFNARRFSDSRLELVLFIVFSSIGLLLNLGLLYVVTEFLKINYLISRMIAATTIFFFNHTLRKYVLFRKSPPKTL